MPKFLVDLTDEDLQGYDPIPAGIYTAKVDASKSEIKSSQAGNDVVTVAYVITSGEYAGRKILDQFTLTPKALWRLGAFLKALGTVERGGHYTIDTRTWHNKEIKIKVVQEEYNGTLRNKVTGFAKKIDSPEQESA